MKRFFCFTLLMLSAVIVGCDSGDDNSSNAAPEIPDDTGSTVVGTPTVAYVTNGIASFWDIAEAGAQQAGKDLKVDVQVHMPVDGVQDQKRMLEDLITQQVDGVAVSPIDSDNQIDLLNLVADATTLITHDSDAADSNRELYIGMSNYDAGWMCGELIEEATADVADQVSIMIFVGRLEQVNARQRRQGLIDYLMKREKDDQRYDKPGQVIENDRFSILGTRTDDFDANKCKSYVEDTLTAYPDITCMVGLFAYNPPQILEALTSADKLNEVHVIGFDEDAQTLQAIVDGTCYGTVVQNPYQYGYQSVKVLAEHATGVKDISDHEDFIDIPARKIMNNNVQEFWDELKKLTGENDADAGSDSAE